MSRLAWKTNKTFSIALNDGTFTIAQMIQAPYVVVYSEFREKDDWQGIRLSETSPLMCVAVTRQFISKSVVKKQNVEPATNLRISEEWIDLHPGGFERVVWKGTDRECTVILIGRNGGALVQRDVTLPGVQEATVLIKELKPEDEAIERCELSNIRMYPEFNERLTLCHQLGRNVDPLKDLIFDRLIPSEYEDYIRLLGPRWKSE